MRPRKRRGALNAARGMVVALIASTAIWALLAFATVRFIL